MGTRDELLKAVGSRYRSAPRAEKSRILTEFVEIAGYHRKHAERLLRCEAVAVRSRPRPERRVYDEAVREALVVLWEAADRICGKRLKPLIPLLIPAMERHGHLALDETVRTRLLGISAASIDRVLAPVRMVSSGGPPRRNRHSSAVRRSVPIRTYADWNDPTPGFMAADLVAHVGPSASGSFVQTLTLIDVATGWTECAWRGSPSPARDLVAVTIRHMWSKRPAPWCAGWWAIAATRASLRPPNWRRSIVVCGCS